mgnify:CR=1 FL=1
MRVSCTTTSLKSGDFCGVCHNEKDPWGLWVKSTHLEWKEGPYAKEGVPCQKCHMTYAKGRNATMANELPDVAQHLFQLACLDQHALFPGALATAED